MDDYRWLEDAQSAETVAWVEAQNEYTRSILDGLPERERMRSTLERLYSIGSVGSPVERGGRLFFTRREGDQNQMRLLFRRGVDGADSVAVDPNRIDPNGTTAIDWWHPSWDGRFVAYGVSTGGNEQSTMRIFDCEAARDLEDEIPFTRFSTVGWVPDSTGFYYTAVVKTLPNPGDVSSYYHRAVYLHRLGDNHLDDEEIFPDDGDPESQPAVVISADGAWLVVWTHKGWDHSHVNVKDLRSGSADWMRITEGLTALFVPMLEDGLIYLHTNDRAPRLRLVAVNPAEPDQKNWREVAPERGDSTLLAVVRAGDHIALSYLSNAHSRLILTPLHGLGPTTDVELPEMSTVIGLHGGPGSDDLFFGLESFACPPSVVRYSLSERTLTLWQAPPCGSGRELDDLLGSDVVTDQVWYRSKDGERVSMFVVHKEGLERDRSAPTVLTGYGGFNQSKVPTFERDWNAWIQAGGVFAVPNLRGGGEYGEEWHRAGMRERKQNVFDDFIAAAEYLIAEGYTSKERLAIAGRSNGGLLVGAAMTKRPDLFQAVVCTVPLLDMVRYHHFLIARLWIPEYGSAEDPDQFEYLHAYSPYHHVSPDVEYPAALFMTAGSDSRVDPLHARKMTALMQSTVYARGPILLRVEFEAGHGAGKPVNKLIDQALDQLSFLTWQTGVEHT